MMILRGTDARSRYLRALIAISAFMVVCTLLNRISRQKFGFVYPFDLSNENIIASWYSGSLLLLAALHSADGYFRLQLTNFRAGLAWAVIAALLFGLSADEVGSLHERAARVLGMGAWLSFLPFALILVGASAWAFLTLWKTPSERRSVPWLILGFAILASVAGQEYLEHNLNWLWYLRPLRSAFEEGSELGGMLLLIHTTMHNSPGLFSSGREPGPAFNTVDSLRVFAIAVGALAIQPMAALTAALPDQELGHPSDWMAGMFFFATAAHVLHTTFNRPATPHHAVAIVAWLVAASAICVQIPPEAALQYLGAELNIRLLLLALCLLGISEALRVAGPKHIVAMRAWLFVAVLGLLLASAGPTSLRWLYALSCGLALVAFVVQTALAGNLLPEPATLARGTGRSTGGRA